MRMPSAMHCFRARVAALSAGLLAAGMATAQAPALAPDQLFERLAPSVWTIETFDAANRPLAGGSGVVVGPGSVVTNCHVLKKASRVVVARENVSYGAMLEHPDPERDLCLLKVRNFAAPAVAIANPEKLRVGTRVYAIGSPRGLEQTISDGLLSGIRRGADGELAALQVTVPISPGSSGGGLFDAHGRLVGITTFALRDSQNLNFAVPATWIDEVPQRASKVLAARDSQSGPPTSFATAPRTYEYRLVDRTTGLAQSVTYQLDRIDGDRLVFNGGTRIESRSGEVLSVTAAGGEADASMPPGGWFRAGATAGARWKLDYTTAAQPQPMHLDLQARVVGEPVLRLADRDLQTVQIEFTGYIDRLPSQPGVATGRYKATAWYAPELNRLVRFEVYARGGITPAQFIIDERLELVAIY